MKKVFFVIIFWLLLTVVSFADDYSNMQYHFSLTIPHGWREIPKSKIDERARRVANATGTKFINYIVGFQENGTQDFGYPYILLQYHDLRGIKFSWENFVDTFANMNLSTELDKPNNTGYKSFIDDFNTIAPLVDRSKKMIIHNAESSVTGVGIIRGIGIVYLGKNGIIQVNIMIPKNNYNKYSPVINSIIETLKFDYGYLFIDSVSKVHNNIDEVKTYKYKFYGA